MRRSLRWEAVTIVATYALLAIIWITVTDRVLLAVGFSLEEVTALQSVKGVVFVLVTSILLYFQIRAATKALQAKQSLLASSEARFRQWAELASDWFWETDKALGLTFLSSSTGVRAEHALQLEIGADLSQMIESGLVTPLTPEYRQVIGDQRPFREFLFNVKSSTGPEISLSVSGDPLFDGEGRFLGYRGIATDITERRLSEELLRRSQRMEAIGQLTSGIAHDFNNLLSVMVMNLEMLNMRAGSNPAMVDSIGAALQATRRGAQLTRRLLAFSRREAEATMVTKINDVIGGMQDIITVTLPSNVSYHFMIGENLWDVELDPGELEDALLNMVINARDAMPNGGKLVIETENRSVSEDQARLNPQLAAGDYVVLAISDSGTGIANDDLELIFDPFFSTKPAEKGTGLGLSMVYGFVQRAGGEIKVSSQVDYGTTFRIFLPRTKRAHRHGAPQ